MSTKATISTEQSEILNDLLQEAAENTNLPPAPPKGIPRQRLPSFIRKLLRWTFLPFVLLDLNMQRIAKKVIRPPFKKEGACLKRGNCCHYVLIQHSKTLIGRLFYFWYTEVNGFYLRYQKPKHYQGKLMYVMGCRHLSEDGSCKEYRLRPLICRKWPVIESFGFPKILKGCGFRSTPPYPKDYKEDKLVGSSKLKIL